MSPNNRNDRPDIVSVPDGNFKSLLALRRRVATENEEKYKSDSKKRLAKIADTKVRTVFIGALAKFEEKFGFLWGYGQEAPLTPEQEELKELWIQCRTEVLNHGNNQRRALLNEIENQTVSWNRHHMSLPVKPLKSSEEGNE